MKFIKLIIWKEFKQIHSDPLTIRLIILPVFLQMFILGYALTTEVKNITITVLDRNKTPQSASLVTSVINNKLFRFAGYAESEEEVRAKLDRGEAKLGIIVPSSFSYDLLSPKGAHVSLLIDGQDANSSNIASGYVFSIIQGWSISFLKNKLASMGIKISNIIPLEVRPVILFNPMLKSTWYMVPGFAVILVTMITAILTAFSLVKEKESGTLEQLLVTPISSYQIVLGKIVPYIIIGLFELTAVLISAVLWFRIPFRGNFLTILIFGLIYMTSSLGVGILVSTIAKNAQQVLFLLWFILIFFLFLSGFFLPIENLPPWVQNLTCINPLKYFIFICREMFLKGSGILELWKESFYMLIIGCIVFTGSLLTFKRRIG